MSYAAHGLTFENIKTIDVGYHQKPMEICDNRNPKKPYETKFIAHYCAALALRNSETLRNTGFAAALMDYP